MECFPVRYDSRVVIYDRRAFIRLATGVNIPWSVASPALSMGERVLLHLTKKTIKIRYKIFEKWGFAFLLLGFTYIHDVVFFGGFFQKIFSTQKRIAIVALPIPRTKWSSLVRASKVTKLFSGFWKCWRDCPPRIGSKKKREREIEGETQCDQIPE